ncbi:MAG: metallophosphoesterase family protein [Bacillota bacterium]
MKNLIILCVAVVCGAGEIFANDNPDHLKPRSTPLLTENRKGPSYSIVVLGDTHYDKAPASIYHSHYLEENARLNKVQRAEFARNGAMWAERCPRLIEAAAKQVQTNTVFAMQMGDLVQGDCGDPEVHKRMLDDTLDYFKKVFGGTPFLTVTGNHDIRGTGAAKAYYDRMPVRLSKEMGFEIPSVNFSFVQGPDLFVLVDFNAPDAAGIRKALEENASARYKFIITHGSVIPSDNSSVRWFLFGRDDKLRREMRELFLKNDVIVFAGHSHLLEFQECVTDSGRITQVVVNSVWSKDDLAIPKVLADRPADYGERQKAELENGNGAKLLEEYKPAMTRYYLAQSAGFCRLDVSPSGVVVQYFGGDASTPTLTFKLR